MTFPETMTKIGEFAFRFCSGLTSVTFPEGLTTIGDDAFYSCSGLTSVTFNSNVSVDANTFEDTYCKFYGYGVTSDNMMYAPDGVLRCASRLIKGSVQIPSGITSIGSSVFSGYNGLTSVTFPEGLTAIGEDAFRYCSGLTSVTFPEGLTEIGQSAFYGCSGDPDNDL